MAIPYKVVKKKSNPLLADSLEKYYPQLVTLGRSVDLEYLTEKIRDNSSLSGGEVKSVLINFVEKMKEQLLEGKTVNILGLGVFYLAAKSKGVEKEEDLTDNDITSVRICFQANKSLKLTRTATRASERMEFVKLEDYLKWLGLSITALDGSGATQPDNGSGEEDDDDIINPGT